VIKALSSSETAGLDATVDGNAVAGRHDQSVADPHLGHGHAVLDSAFEAHGHRRLQGQQVPRRRAGVGAQAMVQIAADQQQKQQRHRSVEIGVLARQGWSPRS
jgi:hypothetical protein